MLDQAMKELLLKQQHDKALGLDKFLHNTSKNWSKLFESKDENSMRKSNTKKELSEVPFAKTQYSMSTNWI